MNISAQKIISTAAAGLLTGMLYFGASLDAIASEQTAGSLKLTAPWIRASVPGQVNGAGYVQIENKSADTDRLIAATTAGVNRAELHTIINENGVAKMREVQGIDVPAKGAVKLAPGGYHIMFLGLSEPFKAGGSVPVMLKFEKAGEVKVNFEVKPPSYNPGSMSGHGSMTGHGSMKH